MNKITAIANLLGVVKNKTVQIILACLLGLIVVKDTFFDFQVYQMRIEMLQDENERLKEKVQDMQYDLLKANPTPTELGYIKDEQGNWTRPYKNAQQEFIKTGFIQVTNRS